VFHVPRPGLVVPGIPTKPDRSDIASARRLLLEELLVDFMFVSDAETAHTVALLVQPFVRSLIDGPTPLFLVESPTPGTGKGLLTQVCMVPAIGGHLPMMTEGGDEAEWRKRITAKLVKAPMVVVIDNLRERLDSSNLSAALTAPVWEDRLMRTSVTPEMPITCTWIATGNNPSLSDEMLRRAVRIRMDTRMEHPEDRTGFRHEELLKWAEMHRGELIAAALTLARAWYLRRNMKSTRDVPRLGTYESWSRVMGGILKVAEIPGFLTNVPELRANAGGERQAHVMAFAEWYKYHKIEVALTNLAEPVLRAFGIDPDSDSLSRDLRSFGMRLAHMNGSQFGPYRLERCGLRDNTRMWLVTSSEIEVKEPTPLHAVRTDRAGRVSSGRAGGAGD
jgi:putative DNA primase/helicase